MALLAAAVVIAFNLAGEKGKTPADTAAVQKAPVPSVDKTPQMAGDGSGEKKPAAEDNQVGKAEPEKTSAKTEEPAKQPAKVAPKTKRLPRIVDVGGENCIPCKLMVPLLDELRAEYKGKLEVITISKDKDPDALKRYRVSTIPTQILYGPDGREIARHFGFFAKEDIVAAFEGKGIKL